jgi:hypothetical protein
MIELLAEYAHTAWCGWMAYLFSKCTLNADGTMTIPSWAVERWTRQTHTPYAQLPEDEKLTDRQEAATILSMIRSLTEGTSRVI